MLKKVLSFAVVLCILFTMGQSALAVESSREQIVSAKIAAIQNVNDTGSNIEENMIAATSENLNISIDENKSITISTIINGEATTFWGTPVGRTENGKIVFFEGTSSNPALTIINFSYEKNSKQSHLYFDGNQGVSDSIPVLKLYLRVNSETSDYYFIEGLGFDPGYSDDYIISLPQNSLLGAWVATQFEAISTDLGIDENMPVPMATSSVKNWYCTKTFTYRGETQTHTVRWRTQVDYSNVRVGQEALQYYRLTLSGKEMTYTFNTDLNSTTESYLNIDGIKLCQTSVPNTAWKSTIIDGSVKPMSGGSNGELSVSLGVSLGILSISYTLPTSFTPWANTDINSAYDGYENGVNGKYTRSIETEMDSPFYLVDIGDYFEVISSLRDYGNVSRTAQSLQSRWYVDIINTGIAPMQFYSYYCDHNVNVAISN